MKFGNAVSIDGSEVSLDNKIDGGEVGVFYNKGGSNDYNGLANKPKINGVTVIGMKEGPDYHLQNKMEEVTPQDIDKIIYGE